MSPVSQAQRTRVSQAHDAVAARPAGIDQAGVVSPSPAELADHVTRLGATPEGARMRAEGWEIAIVDLAGAVAVAPSVFTDSAVERAASLDPGDLRANAELTLPASRPRPSDDPPSDDVTPIGVSLSPQNDHHRRAYVINSPIPNLTVADNFDAPGNRDARQPGGLLGFGFKITVAPSFIQVARFQEDLESPGSRRSSSEKQEFACGMS